jgi:hypothetical protein
MRSVLAKKICQKLAVLQLYLWHATPLDQHYQKAHLKVFDYFILFFLYTIKLISEFFVLFMKIEGGEIIFFTIIICQNLISKIHENDHRTF